MTDIKAETNQAGDTNNATPAQNERVDQFDPNGVEIKQVMYDIVTGVNYLLSDWRPSIIVDCHMHIMSGNCSSLPFLWKQLANNSISLVEAMQLERERMEILGMGLGWLGNIVTHNPILGEKVKVPGVEKPEYRESGLSQAIPVNRKSTYEIGKAFVKERMKDVYDKVLLPARLYEGVTPVFFCIPMTMDMEYAHLDGYYGFKIYNVIYKDGDAEKKPTRYWTPLHGRWIKRSRGSATYYQLEDHPLAEVGMEEQSASDFAKNKSDIKVAGLPGIYYNANNERVQMSIQAVPFLLPNSETDRYEQWKTQLAETEFAMLANPLKMLPLFHYDPRRWQVAVNPPGNTKPFEEVGESGLYLGFKMYTAQGYRPWDVDRLPIMKEFYARCETQRIPIMNHCTPGGAPTYDWDKYIKFTHDMDSKAFQSKKLDARRDAKKYFDDNFVAPNAWKDVLANHPRLRICLAHFGGGTKTGLQWFDDIIGLMKNYPYVYADISSSLATAKTPKFKARFKEWYAKEIKKSRSTIRHRILFGTDWYMTLLDGVEYLEYCNEAKNFLDEFDNDLWVRVSQVNPYRFYRLDEQIMRIAQNITEKRKQEISIKVKMENEEGKNEEVQKVLEPLKKKDIDDILDSAAYIRSANEGYLSLYSENVNIPWRK